MSLSSPKKVIVPLDVSEESWTAVWAALELADREAIRLLYVLEPLAPTEPGVVFGGLHDEDRAAHVRDVILGGLAERGLGALPVDVRVGSPGITICDHAADLGADLVVLASHGRTGVRRLLLGSVAEVVVRYAPCPVLVLRRKDIPGAV